MEAIDAPSATDPIANAADHEWPWPGLCGACVALFCDHDAVSRMHDGAEAVHLTCESETSCALGALIAAEGSWLWQGSQRPGGTSRLQQLNVVVRTGLPNREESRESGNGLRTRGGDGAPQHHTDINCMSFIGAENATVLQLEVSSTGDNPASLVISTRPRERDLSGPTSMKIARHWLADCLTKHPNCPRSLETKQMPSRLLDISAGQEGDRVRLKVSEESDTLQYAALSYCWGTDSQAHALTAGSELEWLSPGFALNELPALIQDAIKVTRGLGLSFLWIDSLCIIQDSEADKTRELTKMLSIYENACVTICIADRDCSSSFLGHAPSAPTGVQLPLALPWAFGTDQIGTIMVDKFVPYSDKISASRISRRGWTLQERLISPRLLIYSNDPDVVFWDCPSLLDANGGYKPERSTIPRLDHSKGVGRLSADLLSAIPKPRSPPAIQDPNAGYFIRGWFEGGLKMISDSIIGRPPPEPTIRRVDSGSGMGQYGELFQEWLGIIEDFSQRELSRDTDRLPAISGLASKFGRTLDKTSYIAGHWIDPANDYRNFIRSLTWTQIASTDSDQPPGSREYLAPSWSWAKAFVPVRWAWRESRTASRIKIVGFKSLLQNEQLPYGRVLPGTCIEVEGALLPLEATLDATDGWCGRVVIDGRNTSFKHRIIWENGETPTASVKGRLVSKKVKYLHIVGVYGLVLERTAWAEGIAVLRRVGHIIGMPAPVNARAETRMRLV
ncbi:heterokaryon incompatibility protein-domain-containing protein [Plectosphaerella plurivora]|uniref:Heterokaryon incompatibility protein-domain-containing protein n=1 Tax=Plectosphaerella plurivora TaxID=936078 RepID=A0A9P8VM91_9PEZI|nr:heterokaryon incompatibility protein-domain-containing protein [Plectosphaerella plurivora]